MAGELLEGAIAAGQRDPRLHRALGKIYLLENRPHKAAVAFQEALKGISAKGSVSRSSSDDDVSLADMEYLWEQDIAACGVRILGPSGTNKTNPLAVVSSTVVRLDRSTATEHQNSVDLRGDSDLGNSLSGGGIVSGLRENSPLDDLNVIGEMKLSRGETYAHTAHDEESPDDVLLPDAQAEVIVSFDHLEFDVQVERELASIAYDFEIEFYEDDGSHDENVDLDVPAEIDAYIIDYQEDEIELEEIEPDLMPDAVGRQTRARQYAVRFIESTGWDSDNLDVLTDFFVRYGWSAARMALLRQVDLGLSAEELPILLLTRDIWAQCERYWASFDMYEQSTDRYKSLSWGTALQVLRSFNGFPSEVEIEEFLEDEFDKWYTSGELRYQFHSFSMYLKVRVSGVYAMLPPTFREGFSSVRAPEWDDGTDVGNADLFDEEIMNELRDYGIRFYEGDADRSTGMGAIHDDTGGEK